MVLAQYNFSTFGCFADGYVYVPRCWAVPGEPAIPWRAWKAYFMQSDPNRADPNAVKHTAVASCFNRGFNCQCTSWLRPRLSLRSCRC